MDTNEYVYLDYAASAPLRKEAALALEQYQAQPYSQANPNSLHSLGRRAAQELTSARETLVRCLGGKFRPQELVFTSGGTEANNISILGIAEGARQKNKRFRIVISAIEHDSILDLAAPLKQRGFDVVTIRPNRDGIIEPESLAQVVDQDTALVSIMYANNETGVIQPISELADVAHGTGALMHTDAIQAFGRIPLDLAKVDCVTAAAHKIGGPHGIGFMALRRTVPYKPQVYGGGQEFAKRPGTQAVGLALAFAATATVVCKELEETRHKVQSMAHYVISRLCFEGSGIHLTSQAPVKLPGIVSLTLDKLDSQTALLKLDQAGFAVSGGSACASASLNPSHVLSAMGIPSKQAYGALRISFDERVKPSELEAFCDTLLTLTA